MYKNEACNFTNEACVYRLPLEKTTLLPKERNFTIGREELFY